MKIKRRFTQAGQSPYEGIKWESRLSEIRNPDGSIVFQLDGVKVPSSWSSVATDVDRPEVLPPRRRAPDRRPGQAGPG